MTHRPALVLVAALLLLCALSCSAKTVYVKLDSPGPTFDGASWDSAFHTVQAGLNASVSGDEVWVATGTYAESITLKGGVALYGGYAGVGITRGIAVYRTRLEGKQSTPTVRSPLGATSTTRIDGFMIRNNYYLAIYCQTSSPTIANNTVTGSADFGILCYSSSAIIINNIVWGNFGGVYSGDGGSPLIVNNTIVGNGNGDGIHSFGSSPTIVNNIIAFNASGIAYYREGTPILRNNCVYGNRDYDYHGIAAGSGDTQLDPLLGCREYNNLHVQPGSPCIDAGDDSVVQPGWIDNDGEPRIQGSHVDIGADESDGTNWRLGPYAVVRVQSSGSDDNDGSSWTLAKQTVQAGIDTAAEIGGDVWVSAGTYDEQIVVRAFAYVYGGFNGTESSKSERDRTANPTILDGSGGPAVTIGTRYQFSTIDGFTIQNGSYGIRCQYSSPTIVDNVFTGNKSYAISCLGCAMTIANNAVLGNNSGIDCSSCSGTISKNIIRENKGAGVRCQGPSPVIADNVIVDNGGSAIYCYSSSATITNNMLTGNTASYGAGVYCSSSSPAIIDNRFVGNSASGSGGAIYCISSSPTIADNIFTGNSALAGGAVACYSNSLPRIDNNTFTGNSASTSGGGIYCSGSAAVITHNVVTENAAASDGGGIHCLSSSASITHNTVRANTARNGGGVHCSASSTTIANNTISGNTASLYGGGVYCYSNSPSIVGNTVAGNSALRAGGMYFFDSSPALSDNIIGFNSSGILTNEGTPVLRNNCVYGNTEYDYSGISAGTGDISDDPLLVNAALGDYHLRPDSPCINAGWNDAPGLPLSDMDGESRIVYDIVDIGADEFPLGTCLGYTKPIRDGGSVSLSDLVVSAAFDGCFYIEAADRSAGIRIEKADHGIRAGDRVDVSGNMGTSDDGERLIEATSVVADGIGNVVPIGLPNRSVGGAGWFYNPGTGAGQRGVKEWRPVKSDDTWVPTLMDSTGMNNIGLLARTWGKVTYLGDIYFYLDDGSKLDDGSGHIGVKVTTEGLTMPALDSYVKVTGASSCYKRDGDLFRLIRATEIAPM